jgi:WD40 repeat protein
MKVFQKLETNHSDLIHDISYDFYGKRLATCSSDQDIRVWDLNEAGEWVPSCEPWKVRDYFVMFASLFGSFFTMLFLFLYFPSIFLFFFLFHDRHTLVQFGNFLGLTQSMGKLLPRVRLTKV